MDYILSMTFITEAGEKTNFSISGVKPDLTPTQINTLMNTFIEKNIFTTNSGGLVKKSTANVTAKSVTKIDVA